MNFSFVSSSISWSQLFSKLLISGPLILLKWLISFVFKKMSAKYQVCVSVLLSRKNRVPWKKYLIQLAAHRAPSAVLGAASHPGRSSRAPPSCFITQNGTEIHTQGLSIWKVTRDIPKWASVLKMFFLIFLFCLRALTLKNTLTASTVWRCCPEAANAFACPLYL